MEGGLYREPFETVGITPPRGRQGHSVPIPRPVLPGLGLGTNDPTVSHSVL